MRTEQSVIIVTCDGCGNEHIVRSDDDELPMGFHGQVFQIGGGGGSGTETWFACRERCIGRAVKAAVARAWAN